MVCLVKMRETDAPAFVAHFQSDVLGRMSQRAVGILAIPHLTHEQLADPVRNAAKYRIPLVNQVTVLGEPINLARRRSVRNAIHFLNGQQQRLLGVAQNDLTALESWRGAVREGQHEFDGRYRREYLTSARFRRFDEAHQIARLEMFDDLCGKHTVERIVGQTAYLSSGVQPGERVVTDGQIRLAPGVAVNVEEPRRAPPTAPASEERRMNGRG